jgi:hypothetical protein
MSHSAVPGNITYEVETNFAEDTDTTATLAIPHIGMVDTSGLIHNRVEPGHAEQYLNAGRSWITGTMEGTFKTKTDLVGHGSSTTAAVTVAAYETFLGYVIGNVGTPYAGTTITGGTANIPITAASATHPAGGLTFIGALQDTDGEGQAYAISGHATTNLTLLTDLRGVPVNGAVVSGGTMLYPSEAATSSSVSSLRFKLATANYQYLCHGCAPTSYTITGLGPGERPQIEVTWQVAWWEYKASTFPDTTSGTTALPSMTAAGSLFVQEKGTTTNAAGAACRTYHSFSFDCTVGMEILRGPGGVNAYQDIVGYRRTPSKFKVSWVEAAGAATTSPTVPSWTTARHILLTLSTVDGKRVAFYWPNVCPAETLPVQIIDQNLNRIRFTGMAYTNDVTTNALTLSAWRALFA